MVLEKDVRRWVSESLGSEEYIAIEPGRGSTPGAPDFLVPLGNGRQVFLETKTHQAFNGSEPLRPEQERILKRAVRWGVPYFVLCDDSYALGLGYRLYRMGWDGETFVIISIFSIKKSDPLLGAIERSLAS